MHAISWFNYTTAAVVYDVTQYTYVDSKQDNEKPSQLIMYAD